MYALLVTLALATLPSPASELEAAANDVKRLPRSHWRYGSLYNVDQEKIEQHIVALNGMINHVSRADEISRVMPVAVTLPDGSQTILLRFDLTWFCRPESLNEFVRAWEAMADDEPYFTPKLAAEDVLVVLKDQAAIQRGTTVLARVRAGTTFKQLGQSNDWLLVSLGQETGWVRKRDVQVSFGNARFSVSPENADILHRLTGSHLAVFRADWLLEQITMKSQNYFDLRGIGKTEEEFCQLAGVDRDAYEQLRADIGANVLLSGVTYKPRRISFRATPFFSVLMLTRDPKTAADRTRDPINNPQSFVFDGTEGFFRDKKRLQVFWTGDGKGNRAEFVPDFIAPEDDSLPPGAERRAIVAPGSCIFCHNKNDEESGYKSFSNDQLKFMHAQISRAGKDPVAAADARRFYGADLSRIIISERDQYAEAVAAACGQVPQVFADHLKASFKQYRIDFVTAEQAAKELGVSLEAAERTFTAYFALHPEEREPRSYVHGLFEQGVPCSRAAWEEDFGYAWTVMHGVQP